MTNRPDPAFFEDRLIDHAQNRRAILAQCDERAEQWFAGNESFGAIDRVQDPNIVGLKIFRPMFLTKNAVIRAFSFKHGANSSFGLPVGGGYRARVSLIGNC